MELYHVDIRLPDGFRLPARFVELRWTRHAERARNNDRYGEIPYIPVLNLGECQIIEVGMEDNKVCKIVVRAELDDVNDIVFVLIPGHHYVVKTVWINQRNDSHKTLDRSRYVS